MLIRYLPALATFAVLSIGAADPLCAARPETQPQAQAQRQRSQPAQRKAAEAARVRTIWDYKKELGLTDQQSQEMKEAVKILQKDIAAHREKLVAAEQQLRAMIDEESSFDQIRSKLQRIATIQVDMRLADIQTSRRVNDVLKTEQLDRWHDIQKEMRASRE
jgi:hypothetical protein